jgi:hypothetical protein
MDYTAANGRITDERRIKNGLDGKCHGLIQILSGTE